MMKDHLTGDTQQFDRYVGIDYSGAQEPTSSLKGLRIYLADRLAPPFEVLPPPIAEEPHVELSFMPLRLPKRHAVRCWRRLGQTNCEGRGNPLRIRRPLEACRTLPIAGPAELGRSSGAPTKLVHHCYEYRRRIYDGSVLMPAHTIFYRVRIRGLSQSAAP